MPVRTITSKDKYSLITSHIVKMKGTNIGHDVREPLHTITAGGTHHGEVRTFLEKYYGSEKQDIVLITIHGELFRAQGFSDSYIIDRDIGGKPITKTEQVAKCGNSVPPNLAEALVRANATSVFDVISSEGKERIAS